MKRLPFFVLFLSLLSSFLRARPAEKTTKLESTVPLKYAANCMIRAFERDDWEGVEILLRRGAPVPKDLVDTVLEKESPTREKRLSSLFFMIKKKN